MGEGEKQHWLNQRAALNCSEIDWNRFQAISRVNCDASFETRGCMAVRRGSLRELRIFVSLRQGWDEKTKINPIILSGEKEDEKIKIVSTLNY